MARTELEAFIAKHKITFETTFVPFSRSRSADNADERGNPRYSLNWLVTLLVNGRKVMTTDYMAGSGHAPSDRRKQPVDWDRSPRAWPRDAVEWECENGYQAEFNRYGGEKFRRATRAVPVPDASSSSISKREAIKIEPDHCSFLSSLALDSSVLDHSSFEQWAVEFGYERDSRKAESIYRACLEIALQLRAGLGQAALTELCVAAEDF